jgi:Carboxypeptidase regulatory-like domain
MIKTLGVVLSIITFFSCGNGSYVNVTIIGTVKDSASEQPIGNAKVKIKCWAYSLQKWESEYTEKEVMTNSRGEFNMRFSESEALDIHVNAEYYKEFESSITLNKSKVEISVNLDKK